MWYDMWHEKAPVTHSLIRSLTHPLTHSILHSLTHSFTHHICTFPSRQIPVVYIVRALGHGQTRNTNPGTRRPSLDRTFGGTQSECCGEPGGWWALPLEDFRRRGSNSQYRLLLRTLSFNPLIEPRCQYIIPYYT